MTKKTIIVSAINLFEGGPLSILKDCILNIDTNEKLKKYNFVFLVHSKKLFTDRYSSNITFEEYPKSRKSYFYRFYYEYFHFKKIVKKNQNIVFWLSLNDMTPAEFKQVA